MYVFDNWTVSLYTYPKRVFIRSAADFKNVWAWHQWKQIKGAVRIGTAVLEDKMFRLISSEIDA